MLKGLAQHINEMIIMHEVITCGLTPVDVRVIRTKVSGASRGFGFVEFSTVDEAKRWITLKKGILIFEGKYKAILQYSIKLEAEAKQEDKANAKPNMDWFCVKCGCQNFKFRTFCFECKASREESSDGGIGIDEICTHITKTLMLRNLDVLTTKDTVLTVLNSTIPYLINYITGICISRDSITSISRGICYLYTNSTIDALHLFEALKGLTSFNIDGKEVFVSFCKYKIVDPKDKHAKISTSEQSSAQSSISSLNKLIHVDSVAEYSTTKYATTPEEYQHYLSHHNSNTLHQQFQAETENFAADIAQSAIQQIRAYKEYFNSTHLAIPSGTDRKIYPIPDVSTFKYDEISGYYFDSNTGLYYDEVSNCFWNGVIQKYLFYNREKLTYELTPYIYKFGAKRENQVVSQNKGKCTKKNKLKLDNIVSKNMDKWVKAINKKKVTQLLAARHANDTAAVLNDIGSTTLVRNNRPNNGIPEGAALKSLQTQLIPNRGRSECVGLKSLQTQLVDTYSSDSHTSDDEDTINEIQFLNFTTLVCKLCNRLLPNADSLFKHAQLSEIHKTNLAKLKPKPSLEREELTPALKATPYRDRAKERRLEHGNSEPIEYNRRENRVVKMSAPTENLASETINNRMLKTMDWKEGDGLGKYKQGRTDIIHCETRIGNAGLGNQNVTDFNPTDVANADFVNQNRWRRYKQVSEED